MSGSLSKYLSFLIRLFVVPRASHSPRNSAILFQSIVFLPYGNHFPLYFLCSRKASSHQSSSCLIKSLSTEASNSSKISDLCSFIEDSSLLGSAENNLIDTITHFLRFLDLSLRSECLSPFKSWVWKYKILLFRLSLNA